MKIDLRLTSPQKGRLRVLICRVVFSGSWCTSGQDVNDPWHYFFRPLNHPTWRKLDTQHNHDLRNVDTARCSLDTQPNPFNQ